MQGAFVFHDPRTKAPWAGDKPIREWHWRPALVRAGVQISASTLLSAGENPMWVARQMGHKEWVMIVRTYARWVPGMDPTAGDKAAALFTSKGISQTER